MKIRLIIASAFTVLSLSIITSTFVEAKPEIQATAVEETKVTIPEVPEETLVSETIIETAPVEQTIQNTPNTDTQVKSFDELYGEVIVKVLDHERVNPLISMRWNAVVGVIMSHYELRPELFTESTIDTTIDQCMDHYEQFSDNYLFSISIMKNDCGI
jgi:hypothetical protein